MKIVAGSDDFDKRPFIHLSWGFLHSKDAKEFAQGCVNNVFAPENAPFSSNLTPQPLEPPVSL